jgi:hypothetical protein
VTYFNENIRLYLKLSIILGVLFVVFYGGSNWINWSRDDHFHLYFQWELGIPFIPWMILVYLSLQLLFLAPVFHCHRVELIVLAKRLAMAICLASLIFVLVPTISGFERPSNPVFLQELFSMLYVLDKPHNLFPSLHITLSTLVVIAVTNGAGIYMQAFYSVWLLLLFLSVLLIHQHHIADTFGGAVLAYLCVRITPHMTALSSD